MIDWSVLIPTAGAVVLGAFRLIAYWLRLRAAMAATPAQLEAINKIEPPVFLRSGGPALALLALGGAMATLTLVTSHQAQGRPDCTPQTCKPPARCTSQGCADVARPPKGKAETADALPLKDSSIPGDPAWAIPCGVWDGRVDWIGG